MERIVVDGDVWRVDVDFLRSTWTCVWGTSCQGIGETPDSDPHLGCCSLGAEFTDDADAANVAAAAACCDEDTWAHHALGRSGGIFADETRRATAVVDGACIFWNPPGFAGGAGCALHLAAARHGDPALEWKPNVCWQLPLRIEAQPGSPTTLRRWRRSDFGADGASICWFCTDDAELASGDTEVIEALDDELRELVGDRVADAIGAHLRSPRPPQGIDDGGPGPT